MDLASFSSPAEADPAHPHRDQEWRAYRPSGNAFLLSVIKVFETASRANGGRLWLVWLMRLRGSPLVLQAA
jgi:hypothetical protein